MLDQPVACYGISFFVPGEGACGVGCRLAASCRSAYLASASTVLTENPAALADDERRFVLEHTAPAAPQVEQPAAREPRKSPTCWTGEKRRPLSKLKASSVATLAAEVLQAAGQPMHVRAVTEEVLQIASSRGIVLGGKTPAATVGLALRQLCEVKQVGRGTYAWIDPTSAERHTSDQIGLALGGAA